MSTTTPFFLDLIAIVVLTFGIYFPRHRRRDMVVAFLGVNIGVLAVAEAFTSTEVTAGLGFGLFGVLSIIRLRSTELDQQEVAYFFAALALGILGGVPITPDWLSPALMGALLVTLFVGDHPRLFSRHRAQRMLLDRAFTDETALRAHLTELLGARIHRIDVRRVDLVQDTTDLDVRFEVAGTRTMQTREEHEVIGV